MCWGVGLMIKFHELLNSAIEEYEYFLHSDRYLQERERVSMGVGLDGVADRVITVRSVLALD
jgi:hypothetical protein